MLDQLNAMLDTLDRTNLGRYALRTLTAGAATVGITALGATLAPAKTQGNSCTVCCVYYRGWFCSSCACAVGTSWGCLNNCGQLCNCPDCFSNPCGQGGWEGHCYDGSCGGPVGPAG